MATAAQAPARISRAGQVPIGPVVVKGVALLVFILGGYLLVRPWFDEAAQKFALRVSIWFSQPGIPIDSNAVSVNGIWINLEPYALTAILTIIGVNIFIFRSRFWVGVLATITGVAIVIAGYALQIVIAVMLATMSVDRAALFTSSLFAFVLVLGTFILGFVVQLQIAIKYLTRVQHVPLDPPPGG